MALLAGLGFDGAPCMVTGSSRALLMARLVGAGIGRLPRRMALPAGFAWQPQTG
ncbi:MAG: hypothetical protein WCO82_03620 [Sphingomonadales bacterium]|jgi:sorbitol-specific phosphotransferase system component IIBC